ncbi:MAG TPA: CHAT domain-containing protein [Terriglobales bacterium]|nr:CHAT domain-containing protein [Terriglobales bacterium]
MQRSGASACRGYLALAALFLLALPLLGQGEPQPAPPDVPTILQQAHALQKQGKLDDAITLVLENADAVRDGYGGESLAFAEMAETLADFYVLKARGGPEAGGAPPLSPEDAAKVYDACAQMYRLALAIQQKFPDTLVAEIRLRKALADIHRSVEPPPPPAEPGATRPEGEKASASAPDEEALRAAREEEARRAQQELAAWEKAMEEQRAREARQEAAAKAPKSKKTAKTGKKSAAKSAPKPEDAGPVVLGAMGGTDYDASKPDWGQPTPPPSSGTAAGQPTPPQYQTKAEYTFPDETVEGNLEKPPRDTLERYPTIESPDAVAPGQEFAVQVSLTEEQITPEARVQQGATTAEGKLALALPQSAENQWKIDVALSAPGLEFARGSNLGSLVLPRQGDSTVAIFYLRARPMAAAERSVHLMATLWYQGSYLARIERDLVIRNPQGTAANLEAGPAQGGAAPAARAEAKAAAPPAARAAPKAAAKEAAPAAAGPSVVEQRRAALDLGFVPPDLTVVLLHNPGDNTETIILESPHLQPAQYTTPRTPGLAEWLAAQYRQIAARSSRGMQPAGEAAAAGRQSTDDFLRGFGRQLYLQFAPQPFREAFWTLEDKLGAKFRTIQIFTDDPTLPWELMRPVRADGSGERDFLGMEFSVARWHVTQDTAQLERPPQTEPLEKVVVIAPQYQGETALPGQSDELSALAQLPGYSLVGGDLGAFRTVFQQLPSGLVHFAGHGAVAQQGGAPEYAILLEDGPLDLMTWRGMTPLRQHHHPVVFFNACEVGQSQKVANFVDGWAPAVLRIGASGYIGALWPVNDRVAALFAARFYQAMESELAQAGGRARVSEVLTRTRRDVFRETGDPTALAYVFYGDPNLAFSRAR